MESEGANALVLALGVGAAIFAVIRVLFGLLGWFSRDRTDDLYRKHLDTVWDVLHDKKFFELVHVLLERLVVRVKETVKPPRIWVFFFFIVLFALNIVLFWLMSIWVDNSNLPGQKMGVELDDFDNIETHIIAILLAFMGASLDVVSLRITWALLNRAAKSPNIVQLFAHLFVDIGLALMAVASMIMFAVVVDGSSDQVDQIVRFFLTGEERKLHVFALTLGITSAIPSAAYAVIVSVVVSIWLLPSRMRSTIRHAVYLITTDDRPVLSQLGNVLGSVGGVLAALTTIAKTTSFV